ncbi:MAG: CocE/NonD family hydrolase [Desulfurococcales archaeon]|jgi:predicted acyl esterase|nr:CocE/NonD family hydrolase [Desulfurococcales archaeon]
MTTIFGVDWKASDRIYRVNVIQDVRIKVSDGVEISCDIYRPDVDGRYPAIVSAHPYTPYQGELIRPYAYTAGEPGRGEEKPRASLEAGDPYFFASRGYVHVICNLRGTGRSGGSYCFNCRKEVEDVYEIIEWISKQDWCSGNVGMMGISYLGWIQLHVASLKPPHLRCIFAPMAATDRYRDVFYHGGILNYGFLLHWVRNSLRAHTIVNFYKERYGAKAFEEAIKMLLRDEDIAAVEELINILRNPDHGVNPLVINMLIHSSYDEFWEERNVDCSKIEIPAYVGANWGTYGIHLDAAFRCWEELRGPKKLIIGPLPNVDRPFYQLHYEALRWFDYWLKGIDTGIMREPDIRIFIMEADEWREASKWPLLETKWAPFFLHDDGLMYEKDPWPDEGSSSYEDSPYQRGYLKFITPPFVEKTEILGPILANIYASTTSDDIYWVISLILVKPDSTELTLTKGWLRASYHNDIDPIKSRPWKPYYRYVKREPLTPGKIYRFSIPLVPTGVMIKPRYRLAIKISSVDDPPKYAHERPASGHIRRQKPSRITVYHNAEYPSHILLPITRGGIFQLYVSGGLH